MIHCYRQGELNIVLDVNSGSIHVVDDVTMEVLSLYETKSHDEIKEQLSGRFEATDISEALEEIEQLKQEGSLFTEDEYREKVIDYKRRPVAVKALCLHIAHDCNLSCRYCFAEEGEYHDEGHRALMSFEVGKAALDFMVKSSGVRRNLEVDFFGGEPTLNFDVVKRLVEYGRSIEKEAGKNFRFTLTTNGIAFTEDMLDFVNREMSNVVLSIDGRREVNDRMRRFPNGKGSSYDVIVPKFQRIADSRNQTNYYVRGTFTHFNTDFSEDVKHLSDLGFKQVSVEPVVAPSDMEYAIREEDIPVLLEQYDKLAEFCIEKKKKKEDFNFFHFMIDLEGGPCVYKRMSGCGSGTEYMAVTPWGDLYPCHQFVGNKDFLLGNVFDGIKRTDICDEFKECSVYAKPACDSCFAKYYCSGGCAANSYNFSGSITGAYEIGCELQRKRVECAIYIKAATELQD